MLTRTAGMRLLTIYPALIALFVSFVEAAAAAGYQPWTLAIDSSLEMAELPPPTGPKSLDQDWPGMPSFKTHAVLGAPLALAQKRYPVLIFSHGMNSARFFYTALLEELASHGYIVAAIDHTYWGPGVAFSGGRTVPYEDGMDALVDLTSDEIDQMMWAGVSVMVADEVFVERQFAQLDSDPAASNPFRDRLDPTRVGVVGHSMGGQAATRTCLEYAVFKACACLDGLNPFFYLRPKPSKKPFLLLINSIWGTSIISPSLARRYLAAWAARRSL